MLTEPSYTAPRYGLCPGRRPFLSVVLSLMALAIALFGHLEMPSAATAAPSQIAASVPHNHDGRPHKGLSHDGIPVNGSQCVHHAQCVFPAILPGAPILPYLFGSSEFRVADILGGSENPLPQSPPPKRLG